MPALRVSPVAFALLLAVELALLRLATSRHPRIAQIARVSMCAVPLIAAFALRIVQALATRDVLEWDETYYLSAAVTGAAGRGLYPYVFGYGQMAIMGGLGYAGYLYALAVRLAGPDILALRVVSLIASASALVFMWLLVRRLYGAGAAWFTTALVSTLRLFAMSNTVRMDSITFAFATGGLLVVAHAFQHWQAKRWHLAAGLVMGLGLQAHIDTVITTAGCGLLYVAASYRDARHAERLVVPTPLLLFVAGWCLGLAIFVAANVLPDPEAFYALTVRIRVDATNWYSSGTSSLLGSILDPRILIAKESALYGVLFHQLHWLEITVIASALAAALVRRANADKAVLVVTAGVLVAAALVLNNASPLYFIHVVPALVLPLGALFSHGFSRRERIDVTHLLTRSLLGFAVVVSALFAVNNAKTIAWASPSNDSADAAYANVVRHIADPACVIAGDGRLYVRYFADYPYFISARRTEVTYAMLFYGTANEADYWEIKSPGVVFWEGPLPGELAAYVERHQIPSVSDGVWAKAPCVQR
ncbi:MAG TPA: glycosyltransferase family 39 protein [Vicinamibacterales bacterium]